MGATIGSFNRCRWKARRDRPPLAFALGRGGGDLRSRGQARREGSAPSAQTGVRSWHEKRGAFISCRDRLRPFSSRFVMLRWERSKPRQPVLASAVAPCAKRPATWPRNLRRGARQHRRRPSRAPPRAVRGDDDPDPARLRRDVEEARS